MLLRADPSPVVELNRAVAIAMRDGPAAGLALIDAILAAGDLDDYHLAHSARADLCRRLGRTADARASYQRALELTRRSRSAGSSSGGLPNLAPSPLFLIPGPFVVLGPSLVQRFLVLGGRVAGAHVACAHAQGQLVPDTRTRQEGTRRGDQA